MAARLIDDFGSLPELLSATDERIARAAGSVDASDAILRFRSTMRYALEAKLAERPVIGNWEDLMRHLRADLAHLSREQFRIVHLDSRNGLLRSEIVSEGTIDQAMVHAREVVRRALELGSASLILVHNHPAGATGPSRADLDVTKAVAAACRVVGICVHDHVIVGAGGHYSLRANGHMHAG